MSKFCGVLSNKDEKKDLQPCSSLTGDSNKEPDECNFERLENEVKTLQFETDDLAKQFQVQHTEVQEHQNQVFQNDQQLTRLMESVKQLQDSTTELEMELCKNDELIHELEQRINNAMGMLHCLHGSSNTPAGSSQANLLDLVVQTGSMVSNLQDAVEEVTAASETQEIDCEVVQEGSTLEDLLPLISENLDMLENMEEGVNALSRHTEEVKQRLQDIKDGVTITDCDSEEEEED